MRTRFVPRRPARYDSYKFDYNRRRKLAELPSTWVFSMGRTSCPEPEACLLVAAGEQEDLRPFFLLRLPSQPVAPVP